MNDMVKLVIPPKQDINQVTPNKAKELAHYDDEFNTYHNIQPIGFGFIGSDMREDWFDEMIQTADRIELAGENAFKLGHGIAVHTNENGWFFIKHDEHNMKQYLEEKGDMETLGWMK